MFSDIGGDFYVDIFARIKNNLYLCNRNESTPWDYVFKGGQLQDIIKAS